MRQAKRIELVTTDTALRDVLYTLHDYSCCNFCVVTGIMQERTQAARSVRQFSGAWVKADCPQERASSLVDAIRAMLGENGAFCRITDGDSPVH